MGRPRAIQGEVEKRLLEALEDGTPVRLACEYAGISPTTYTAELERNPTFAAHVRATRVKHLPKALNDIRTDADWRAKQAWVQMNFPDDYGRRVEITGAEGGPVKVATEVQPGFVADVLRRLSERSDAPAQEGGE